MPDTAAKWQQDFQKARDTTTKLQTEMQRWELLASQSAAQRGERVKQGTVIRGSIAQLKLELERLQRELETLSQKLTEVDVTRKSITQFRDDLALAFEELKDLQHRSRASPAASSQGSRSSMGVPAGSFVCMMDDGTLAGQAGAELQPVSNRAMLQKQKEMMQSFDEPLTALEGTVSNLQSVSSMIHNEIGLQNRMLDDSNATTDRAITILGRARTLLQNFSREDRNRFLLCFLVILLVILIILFIYVVGP